MRPDSFQIMYFNIHQISSQMRFEKPKMLLTGFILWTIFFTLKLSGSSHHDTSNHSCSCIFYHTDYQDRRCKKNTGEHKVKADHYGPQ